MAAAILFAGVLAVLAAITTGQEKVSEAELQLQATLLAEDKMQGIAQLDYYSIDSSGEDFSWNGNTARQAVDVSEVLLDPPAPAIRGKNVTVTIYLLVDPVTEQWRTLAELKAFIPEPQP